MKPITLAALQFGCSWSLEENVARAERLARRAAGLGAQVILPPELFETPYFCAVQHARFLDLARPIAGHPTVEHFRALAREHHVRADRLVQQTQFANGTTVTVNFGDQPFTFGDGRKLAARALDVTPRPAD